MGFLKKYMPHYLKFALPAWLCLLCEVLVDLCIPTITARIIDEGIPSKDMTTIGHLGLFMLLVTCGGAIAGLTRNFLSARASQDLGTDLRADLFRKTQSLSQAQTQQVGAATLITRLTNDVTQVQNLSFMLTRIFIRAPLLLIGSIIMAVLLNARMSAILLGVLPIMVYLITLRIRRGFPLFQKVQGALDRVNGVMREYLSGVRVVKVFNRFDYEQERFDRANANLADIGTGAGRAMATIQPLMQLIMNGSIVLVIWIGGFRVNSSAMTVGAIVAFVNYFLQILQSMSMLSWLFTSGVRAKTSLDRIGQVFAIESDIADNESPVSPPTGGAVEMRDVIFRYPDQAAAVLEDIQLSIAPGQTAAIIGATGCGKSTLVSLVPRLYDALGGAVLVDGQDVRAFSLEGLRERIALVPQQAMLFTGTIEENLRWGKDDATMEELERAAEIAQAAEFIHRLPNGWSTHLGQGGVNLSGGQKQRLCIARALLRNPAILILDDSTSAVDIATERRIREGLQKHCQGMTVLLVAQRIHTVMSADVILVMDNGHIVSQGQHDDLLVTCDIYRDIYRSQMGLNVQGQEVI